MLGQASIFLVEDDVLIRMMLADMVEELGYRVVAEAGNIQDALALAETIFFDIAILDINIAGSSIAPVATIIASPDISQGISASRRRISESCFARTTSSWFEDRPDADRV